MPGRRSPVRPNRSAISVSVHTWFVTPAIGRSTCSRTTRYLSCSPSPGTSSRRRTRRFAAGTRCTRCTTEAATVRERATQLLADDGQNRPIVVLGDLNDGADAATTQMLFEHPDPRSSRAATRNPTRRRQPSGKPGRSRRPAGAAPHPEVQRAPGDDRPHAGQPRHRAPVEAGRRQGGATDVPSITEDPNERRDAPGSDHRPVFVDIQF